MADFIFFRASDNWYMRIVDIAKEQVWDKAAGAVSASTTRANSAITLDYSAVLGGHPVTLPASLPAGEYYLLFYNAATPADGDAVQVGKVAQWSGAGLRRPLQNG